MSGPELDGSAPPPPGWLSDLAVQAGELPGEWFSRFVPPESGSRPSAVLVLLGPGRDGPQLLLTERASTLRSHAGQVSFPGGRQDAADADLVATALREAQEETGLQPGSVQVLQRLPALHIPVSRYDVTPVLAWWPHPHPLRPGDPAEVAKVAMVPVARLLDPSARHRVRHPSGYVGPAFSVEGMTVWGFTAGVLDRLFDLAGLTRPWPVDDVRDITG